MTSGTCEDEITPEQEARAKLRESFLKAVNTFNGERCSILTYEQSKLSGTFSGWNPDGSEMLFHDVTTPANIPMKSALIRVSDVLAIQFDKPIQLPQL